MMAGSFLCVWMEIAKPVPVIRQNLRFPAKPEFLQHETRHLWRNKHVCHLQIPSLQSASPDTSTQLLALQLWHSRGKINEIQQMTWNSRIIRVVSCVAITQLYTDCFMSNNLLF
jgi:hypothetical protein